MEGVISNIQGMINVAEKASDPRTKDWLFVPHISAPLLFMFSYIIIVVFGQRIMQNRKAFELKSVMTAYNFIAVILSGFIFIKTAVYSFKANYSLACQQVYHTLDNPYDLEIARTVWLFYMSKYFEMADTYIFVLRKKNKQISFLHVYHHATVVMIWWTATKWIPGGSTIIPVLINSFVHVVMYTYYGLSIFPALRKYLWWKRYLTQIQMIQFCCLVVHPLLIVLFGKCSYPHWMSKICTFYTGSLLVLFAQFYLKTYINPKNKDDSVTSNKNANYSNGNVSLKKVA